MQAESSETGAARSLRPRKKRKSDFGADGPDLEKDSAYKETAKGATKKRVKGRLSGLVDLPLDVLFEVFGHLHPHDLLKVSRMTKQFRHLLMHKSAKSVWKAALDQVVGLPACPSQMSEPAWVNLAFDPHCHFCYTTNVRSVEWALRVRICAKCAKDQIMEVYIPDVPSLEPTDDFATETLLPWRLGKRACNGVLISEYEKITQQYEALQGKEARTAFIRERRKFVTENQEHAVRCQDWARTQTRDRSDELQQLKNDRHIAIVKKLEALGYAEDIAGIRWPDSLADHDLVKKPQRLTERVWLNVQGPIIEFMESMRVKRLAREHAQLVLDRKPSAIAMFRTYKNKHLPITDIMPEGLDFCDFPPVKTILEQPADVTVDESSFTEIIPLIPDLLMEWRSWLDKKLIELIKKEDAAARIRAPYRLMMSMLLDYDDYDEYDDRDYTPPPPLDEASLPDTLKLATTVFECGACSRSGHVDSSSSESADEFEFADDYFGYTIPHTKPLFYPKILGHQCLTRRKRSIWSWEPTPEPAKRLDNSNQVRRKWTTRPLRIDHQLGKCVESLVNGAGLDPKTTTAHDMDGLSDWFACLRCAFARTDEKKGPYETGAYMWRDAVKHYGLMHGHVDPTWKKLDSKELQEARDAHDAKHKGKSVDSGPEEQSDKSWLCVHCRDTRAEINATELDLIKAHVQDEHGVEQPEVDKDYYRDFAALPIFPTRCRVILNLSSVEIGDI